MANAHFLYAGSLSWHKHQGKNCYNWNGDWNGADNMSPEPYSNSLSLSDCQDACETDASCEGVVIERGKESLGRCYKRKNIQLSDCMDNTDKDVYLKITGMQTQRPKAVARSRS